MSTFSKDDLLKYIKASFFSPEMVGGVVLLLAAFMSIFIICFIEFSALGIVFALVLGVVGAILIRSAALSSKKFTDYIQNAETSGEMGMILGDFSQSYSMVKDNIRIGRRYIFGKKQGRPVKYSEITKVYQSIHKTNFVEDSRQLNAVLSDGETRTLCNLMIRGKSDEDLARIMGFIQHQNPGVHLGYK